MQDSDDHFLHQLHLRCAPVPDPMLARSAQRGQDRSWAPVFGTDRHNLILVDHQPAGRIWIGRDPTGADRILLPEYRLRGIGTQVLREAAAAAHRENRELRLHVPRSNNPGAHRLYTRLGFVEDGGDYLRISMHLHPRPLS
jgi:GNAT superfamily N-acetyltransferase